MREIVPGKWRLSVSSGFDDGGNRVQHYQTIKTKTKADAEKALRKFIAEVEAGLIGKGDDPLLRDYLHTWLEERATRVEASTLRRYKRDVGRFINPTLGSLRLSALRPKHLDHAYADWQRQRQDGRKGALSAATVAHAHRTLHAALADAVRQEVLKRRNPCEVAHPPKAAKTERRCLTIEQARVLLLLGERFRIKASIALGLGCGLRRNEMLGLKWSDVDWNRRCVLVARSLDYHRDEDGNERYEFKSPKSKRPRIISLPAFVLDALVDQKLEQGDAKGKMGQAYHDRNLVFAHEDGSPLRPNGFVAAFRRAVKAAGLPDCSLHTLRHTYATIALAAGENPLVVSQALGHYDPGFTLREYGHALPGAQARLASSMDSILGAYREIANKELAGTSVPADGTTSGKDSVRDCVLQDREKVPAKLGQSASPVE
jgi:integrase